MKKMMKILYVFILQCILVPASMFAGENPGKLSLGLNYPGFGVKYVLSNKISLEVRGQSAENITVIGSRGYYYLKNKKWFTGLEVDYVTFKGEEAEGTGIAIELFGGFEHFFSKKLAVQLDFGPAFIMLEDKNYTITESALEFVLSIGINYYL